MFALKASAVFLVVVFFVETPALQGLVKLLEAIFA
jgi:hypothetical protein